MTQPEKLERMRQMDFLVEKAGSEHFYEFLIKGTMNRVRIYNDESEIIFKLYWKDSWMFLSSCFDLLPREVQEKLIWHLDVFQ